MTATDDTAFDDRVLDAATERGTLRAEDLLALCEQYDTENTPGIAQDSLVAAARDLANVDGEVALDTRAEELSDQDSYTISDGLLLQELRARRADGADTDAADTNAADGTGDGIYVLDEKADRLSAFPESWHEAIGGETDVRAVFDFLQETEPFRKDERAGTGKVSAERVATVASAVGGLAPGEARDHLSDLEDEGELVEASRSPEHEGLRAREAGDADESAESNGAAGKASGLPPTLDFRTALDEIDARADTDVSDQTNEIRDRLAEFAERDGDGRTGRESLLSDIDRLTVDIESRASGKAARRAEGIRNQIDAYRDSGGEGEGETAAELSFSGASFVDDGGKDVDLAASDGAPASLRGTLVNGGGERRAVVACTFYDDAGDALQTIESRPYDLAVGEQRSVAIDCHAPADAAQYAAEALDASNA